MLKKLHSKIRAKRARQLAAHPAERKVRFEALESRFLLSAEIAIPPPDPHQDNSYDQNLEQTQISQTLEVEEQQQVQVLGPDSTQTSTDLDAANQETADAASIPSSDEMQANSADQQPTDPDGADDTSIAQQASDTDGATTNDVTSATAAVDDSGDSSDTDGAASATTGDEADTDTTITTDNQAASDQTVITSDTDGSAQTTAADTSQTAVTTDNAGSATTTASAPQPAAAPPLPAALLAHHPREIVFVDPAVEDYRGLLDDLLAASRQQTQAAGADSAPNDAVPKIDPVIAPDDSKIDGNGLGLLSSTDNSDAPAPQTANTTVNAAFIDNDTLVVVLDAGRDGIDQISEVLRAYEGVAAVHILSHGSSAALRVGGTSLNSEKLKQYADRLKAWGRSLTPDGDILLYGCNVGKGATGIQFVHDLGKITGADIAASNDDTGSAALGGDWQLEVSTGVIETQPLLDAATADTYSFLLTDNFIAGTTGVDTFTINANDVQLGANSITFASDDYPAGNTPNDNVAVNATSISNTTGTAGDDMFNVTAFPTAQSVGSEPGSVNFNVYGGMDNDTLDFSNIADKLTFAFFDATGLARVQVTDGMHVMAADDIEVIAGGSSINTYDFSDIAANLTFTFTDTGDVSISDGSDTITLRNAANSTIISGKGSNNFTFGPGAQFSGIINGSAIGNSDTFDFKSYYLSALYDDPLTFSGNQISSDINPGLDFVHNGIENVDIDAAQVNLSATADNLTTGLADMVGNWALDVEKLGAIGQTLSGLDGNVDVTLGKTIQISEALDQLRLDLKQFIDGNSDITAQDIQDRLGSFMQANILYADRAIIGEVFNPSISNGDSFGFTISLDGGTAVPITVSGNTDGDAFVANINAALDANPALQGKVKALKVTQDSGYRIAFQVVSTDIDTFALLVPDSQDQDILGFAATRTISGLKDEIQNLGKLDVNVDQAVGVTAGLSFVNGLPELLFNFDLIANRASEFGIDLGKSAEDIGLSFDANAKITANVELNASLGLGLQLNDSATDFFFNLPNLSIDAQGDIDFDAAGVVNDARIGFLAANVGGNLHLHAKAGTSAPDHSDPGMSVSESTMPVSKDISDFDPNLTVQVNVNGLDAELANGLGTFNKDPADPDALSITGHGDPFLGRDVESVDYNNFDNLGLFGTFNAASFISQVGTVRDWFGSVRDSDIFKSVDIPFVTPTLDKVFNLGDTVGDTLLYDQGGDGMDDDTTLVIDLRNALVDAGLDKKVRVEGNVESDSNRITFFVKDPAVSAIAVSGGLGFDGSETFADGKLTAAGAATPVLANTVTLKITVKEDNKDKDYFVTVTKEATANNKTATIGNDHAKLLDENNEATFETTQDLANKLLEMFGNDHLKVKAAYDADTKRLTFALTFDPATFELNVPVDFNFDLSPIGNISTVGSPAISLGAGVDISLTLGLDLSDKPAGTQDLSATTKLTDLKSIDKLADAIKTEYSLSPVHLPLSTTGEPGELSQADVEFIDSGAEMTGNPLLSFDDSSHSITRSDGIDWTNDNFRKNQQITISATGSNNGTFTIQDIQGDTLILSDADKLTSKDESGAKVTGAAPALSENPKLSFALADNTITRSEGSWVDDGFKNSDGSFVDYIIVEGAGANNGAYRIAAISSDGKTLTVGAGTALKTDAQDVTNVTVTAPDRIKVVSGTDLRSQFYSGQLISVTGTQSNNRSYLILDVVQTGVDAGRVLILSASAKTANETIGSDDTGFKISGGPIVRLSHNATFTIDGVPVTLLANPAGENSFVGNTSDNNNLLDLAGDINSALDQAGLKNRIKAEVNNGRIQLTARSELSGNPRLSFSTVDNSITRNDDGSWLDDGFRVGQTVRLSGTANNDDIPYTVTAVDATVLTLSALNADVDSSDIAVTGTYAFNLTTNAGNTARGELGFDASQTADSADLIITTTDAGDPGIEPFRVTLDGATTIQDVIDAIRTQTGGKVKAEVDPDTQAGLRLVQVPSLTGNPRLSFDATGNAIILEDSTRSWSDDGFTVGQNIRVAGADKDNDGVYEISDIVDIGGKNALIITQISGTKGTLSTDQTSVKDVRITIVGDEIFRVEAANGSKIAAKLGILKADVGSDTDGNGKVEALDGDGIINGEAIAGVSVLDRFFIQDPTVTGTVYADAKDGIDVNGDFGLVAIDLTGSGEFSTGLTLSLADPTPDIAGITINELIKSLDHLSSIVSAPTIGGPKVSGEQLTFDAKTITKDTAWGTGFAIGEYISVSGSDYGNDGHYQIAAISTDGKTLTLSVDQDFTSEAGSSVTVLDEIGLFELSLDVNPDFALVNDSAAQVTVALFDFGNPFSHSNFTKDQFTLGDDGKSFTLSGDWTDRITPGVLVIAQLAATSFDMDPVDTGANNVKLSDDSFRVTGDQRDKFVLGAKVTAELLAGSTSSSVASKIKTINYDENTDTTTITVEDQVLTDPLVKVTIATKESSSLVVSAGYDEESKLTTVTVVDKVLSDDVESLFVATPRGLDYMMQLPDLGDLVKFDNLGISQIIDGLIQLSDFLGDFETFGFLSEPLPVINISVNDVLAYADRFDAAVQEAQNNPAGTLQALKDKLKETLGIPSGTDSEALGFQGRQDAKPDTVTGELLLTGEAISDAQVASMTKDAVFLLSLDNGPSQLIKVITADANTVAELVTNVNTALSAAFGSNVQARQNVTDKNKIEFFTPDGNKPLAISNPIDLSIDETDGLQLLRIDFGLGIGFTKSLNVDFDLGDTGVLSGSAGLEASGAVDFNLGLGIDLNNPDDVYLFDSTITGQLTATGNDLAFRAGVGPLGVFINGGVVSVGGDIGNKLFSLGLDFDGNNATREGLKLISDVVLADDFSAEFSGKITADLPVYFPAETLHKGAVVFDAGLSVDGNGDLVTDSHLGATDPDGNTTKPDGSEFTVDDLFDVDLSQLSLMDNMLLAVDGLDAFLGGLQDTLDGEVFGVPLPLVGDKLSDGARFIEDFRDDFIAPFRDEIQNMAVQDQNIVSEKLFELLGPAGLGLLLDANNDGAVTIDDITLDTNVDVADGDLNNDYMQWNMQLGQEIDLGTGIGLDLGIPGLGLETQGDINVNLGWNLDFGFGISFEDAFYLDISNDSELEVGVDVTLPNFGLTGKLAFLQLDAGENTANPEVTHFTAKFGVNVTNKNDKEDKRLAFSELGNMELDAGIAGEAVADLHLELKLNSDLAPNISGVFPKVVTDFYLNWSIDGDPNTDGLQLKPFSELKGDSALNLVKGGLNLVEFRDVSLDLGSFISDFIEPVLGTVRQVTDPLQPIIDFLTTPLPVISDLGPSLSLLDIAAATGKVNTGFIESVADVITFINAIPLGAETVLLDFGNFTIFDKSDPSVNPDVDVTDPTTNLDNVAIPQDRSSKEQTPDHKPVSGTKTQSFTDKIKSAGDFDFPIISDPTQIFNLLLGKDAVLMTFDLKPLVADFAYKQFFPIYPPLGVAIKGEISAIADFAFGFDTTGIKEFSDGGFRNPGLIFDGFFISDTNIPSGDGGADVPELTLSGGLSASAEINLGIASGGAGGGVFVDVFFNLFDPNHDGKVRIPEMMNNIINEYRYGSPAFAPMALFDVSGDVYAKLFAYVQFLFFEYEFDITPPITLLTFDIPFTRVPTLATDIGDGVLQLNMGEFASQRLNNDTTDGDEVFTITGSGSTVNVSATFGGTTFTQTYSNVSKILALAGEGDDTIDLTGLNSNSIEFDLDGGVGNDRILLSDPETGDTGITGNAVIRGGVGDDVITGGGGNDQIYGGAGNDTLSGGDGRDILFGDEGDIAYREDTDGVVLRDNLGNKLVDYTRARINVTDGDDIITGGAGDDRIFGGGGEDNIDGGEGNDLIIGDGGILRDVLSISAHDDVTDHVLTDSAVLEFLIDSDSFTITLPAGDYADIAGLVAGINDQLAANAIADRITAGHDGETLTFTALPGVLDMRVKGANDTATSVLRFTPFYKKVLVLDDTDRGLGEADTLFGGSGDDVIYGGRGDDTLSGNEGDDRLFGEDGFDTLYGNTGDDRLFGGNDNDTISGGGSDDHIEGGAGNDTLWGDWMADEAIDGIAGVDSIWGGTGMDTLFGGAQGDYLFGESDPDTIFGEEGDDTIDGGHGADKIFGGVGDDTITSSLGDDFIDGGSGSDEVTINTLGGDMSSRVTVFDSGAPAGDGTDTLIVNGTAEADSFLLRAAKSFIFDATLVNLNTELADVESRLASLGEAKSLQLDLSSRPPRAFIAKLNNDDKAERINYYDNFENIIVNTLDGADFVASDNTNAAVTVNGGNGDDTFQVGQLYNSPRDEDAGIDPYDVFDTVQTTQGFLSSGINAPMTINGEDGNDSFVVFRNLKVLTLNGGDGDDEFLVKAFALEGSVDDPDRDLTDITGAGGADLIQYAVNAPVEINGGDGLDTVVVLGTEFGDDFVVTDQGVYGAGLNVNFAGIEVLKLDTAEGNDRIFVLGTGSDHITEIYAGNGSDAYFIGGDTPPVVSQDLLGHSGVITHTATSGDARFDGISVDGISANVGDNNEPFIRVIKNDGPLRVSEDGLLTASYSLVLTREPRALVGITAIAPRPSPNEEKSGAKSIMLNGNQAAEVIFDKSNWYIPQTITVTAAQDLAYEGLQTATINHLVGEYDVARDAAGNIKLDPTGKPILVPVTDAPTYNSMAIPSVNAQIVDDDLPGLVIQQSDGDTRVIEGAAFGAAAPFADDYTLRLNQKPDSNVTVNLVNPDGQLQLEQTIYTFTPDNWNTAQTVRVIAVDDAVKEGFHYGYIRHEVNSAQGNAVVSTTDSFAEVTNEALARSSVLLNHAPMDKAAISSVLVGGKLLEADRYTIDHNQLTLLDKDGQPLAVMDEISVNYSYDKPGFQNVAVETMGVSIGDNDAPGVLILQSGGSTNVIEADVTTPGHDTAPFTDQYQLVLTARPTADVVIDVAPQPTKTSGRPPFVFSAAGDNVAVSELGFTESSDPTISLTSGQPAPDDGRLGGDLVFNIDLTPDDSGDAAIQVTLSQADMAAYQSIDDLIGGINTALSNAGLEDKIFTTRDGNRVVIAKATEPQRQQVNASASTLTFTPDNWNIPQTITVTAINDNVVDGGDIKVFAPVEQTVARIQGPLIINGAGGQGALAGLGADPLRLPGESNDVGNVVEVPTDSSGNILANQVVLDGKDVDKLGPSYFKSLDTFQPGDENDASKAKVIIKITSGPGAGQERVVAARNDNTFILAEDWDTADLPTSDSRYIFVRELGTVDEARQVDVVTVFNNESVADNSGTLTATRLYGLGMGPDMQLDGLAWPGGITYSNMENLTVHMGPGNDTLDAYGAQNRDDFRTVTIVNTGAGNDNVTVDIEAGNGPVAAGTVSTARSQHLQDLGAAFPTAGRGLSGYRLVVTDAAGNVQERTILFNDANTLYVDQAWDTLPQAGNAYAILRHPAGLIAINTQAGDDRIDASTSTAPLIAFGGPGNDVLIGGSGDDILIGDRGRIDYVDSDGNIITRLGSSDIPAPREDNPDDPDNPIVIFRQTDGVFRDPASIQSVEPANGGDDEIHGGSGADLLIGGAGSDRLFGDDGNDVLFGDGGQMLPLASGANYKSIANDIGGDDELHGGSGADLLIGGARADRLFGDDGNDVLIGDGGQKVPLDANREYYETIDNFIGGNDTLNGGTGNDIMIGGFGSDLFVGNFSEDVILGDYGRVTLNNGKVEFILRLGQGSLDLAASTLFSLYSIAPYAAHAVPIPGEAAQALQAAAPQTVTETVRDETRYTSHAGSTVAALPGPGSVPTPEYYVVRQNDTLWHVADIYLGDARLWPEIWALNPQIKDPDLIFPGMRLKLPQAPTQQDGKDLEETAPQTQLQGADQPLLGEVDEQQLALAGLGLLGLRSPRPARHRQQNATPCNPDGAFIFDELNSWLQPYYPGGGRRDDKGKPAELMENLACMTDGELVFGEAQITPVGNTPVIDWEAGCISRPAGN